MVIKLKYFYAIVMLPLFSHRAERLLPYMQLADAIASAYFCRLSLHPLFGSVLRAAYLYAFVPWRFFSVAVRRFFSVSVQHFFSAFSFFFSPHSNFFHAAKTKHVKFSLIMTTHSCSNTPSSLQWTFIHPSFRARLSRYGKTALFLARPLP